MCIRESGNSICCCVGNMGNRELESCEEKRSIFSYNSFDYDAYSLLYQLDAAYGRRVFNVFRDILINFRCSMADSVFCMEKENKNH